jgi:hypothetical protein
MIDNCKLNQLLSVCGWVRESPGSSFIFRNICLLERDGSVASIELLRRLPILAGPLF